MNRVLRILRRSIKHFWYGKELTVGHIFESTSYKTLGACIEVQRQLGPHCMEVDIQRALALALPKCGLEFLRERTYRSTSILWRSHGEGWTLWSGMTRRRCCLR